MSHTQSFKSVLSPRISVADADRVFSQSRTLGDPLGCPISAQTAYVDEFGRPSPNPDKLLRLNDSACSNFVYPVQNVVMNEQVHRPILGPFAIGSRGKSDLMLGVSRDQIPVNMFDSHNGGYAFQSGYGNQLLPTNEQFKQPTQYIPYYESETRRKPITDIGYAQQRYVGR